MDSDTTDINMVTDITDMEKWARNTDMVGDTVGVVVKVGAGEEVTVEVAEEVTTGEEVMGAVEVTEVGDGRNQFNITTTDGFNQKDGDGKEGIKLARNSIAL